MKRVLMVAYHFPPIRSGGVFRTLKFVKYLPGFNWKPYVISVKNPQYQTFDFSLLEEIPPEAFVRRVFSFESRYIRYLFNKLKINPLWILIPDIFVGFLPFGFLSALQLIIKYKIDLIYSTGPPFTSFIIGFLLKKVCKVPLIIDYRDPWTQNISLKYPSKSYKKLIKTFESEIIHLADAVITSTKAMRDYLLKKYLEKPEKFITITNGYDQKDFMMITPKVDASKLNIAHFGSFYERIQPTTFLKALNQLIDSKRIRRDEIKITFMGSSGEASPDAFQLNDVIENLGWLPHKRSLQLIASSHVLYLMYPPKGYEYTIHGKIYEYLALQKPILALVPDGITSNLIKTYKAGIVVHPTDIKSIKDAILKLFKDWKRHKSLNFPEKSFSLRKFERKHLTKKLAKLFDKFVYSQLNSE